MRAQADAAFADAERELMEESNSGAADSGVPTGSPRPWTLFLEDAVDDTRPAEQVEKEVTAALLTTLLEDSSLLKSLQPSDMVTVSVELVARPQPWVRARPARTVTVRAQKGDLDAFTAGRLPKDALLKRVQTQAY